MGLFLASCSLPPDFQQLCICFLCGSDVWVGRILFCGSAWANSCGRHPRANLAYLCALGHTSEAPRDDIMFSLPASRYTTLFGWLYSHKGVDVSPQHYQCQSLSPERERGEVNNGWGRDLPNPTLSDSSLPANCEGHGHTAKEQCSGTWLSKEYGNP